MKRAVIFITLVAAMPMIMAQAAPQSTEPSPLVSLGVWPFWSVPNPFGTGNDLSFGQGAGARLAAEYVLPLLPLAFAAGGLEYGYTGFISSYGTGYSLSILSASLGLGIRVPIADWLTLRVLASGGYYYGFLNHTGITDGGGNPFLSAGLGVAFNLGPLFSLELSQSYSWHYNLRQSIQIGLGAIYHVLPPGGIEIENLIFESVFPVFRTFYDTHPIGAATIRNTASAPATKVSVSVRVPQYMDAAKECLTIPELRPGAELRVDLYALFKPSILDTIQDTKAAAEVTVTSTIAGAKSTVSRVVSIEVHHKNAMTWDPDAKAAAFVTYMDPSVVVFSNNVNAIVRASMNPAIDRNLQTAVAFHDALRLLGISYSSNPLSYEKVSQNKMTVDTLRFPRETFANRSGDCSDLSILYCALLESVQVETAFLTIPGHIFIAFALDMAEQEARRTFADPEDLIFRDGKAWVPVEVTEREKTFLDAWAVGAREWRENAAKNQAGFDRVREAWKTYPAVDLSSASSAPAVAEPVRLLADFKDDVQRHVRGQIASRVLELQGNVEKSGGSPKALNALGVLYARYGLATEAEKQLRTAVAREEYVPALVNLGNLSFRALDMEKALSFYERAYRAAPDDANALLGMARASQELEDYPTMAVMYEKLTRAAPELARQFSSLGLKGAESTRAAETAGAREMMVWAE
jgi:tetratricopeptide (TPR) repeat protein